MQVLDVFISRTIRSTLLCALIALFAWPSPGRAFVEIAKPSVIVMNHLANPVFFPGAPTPDAETAIEAYQREIKEMNVIGSLAVGLNAANNRRDRTRLDYWKEAVRRFNEGKRGKKFCFFLIAGFDPNVWLAETIRSVYESLVDSPYYCSIRAKPVLAFYRGEQQTAEWFLSDVFDPMRADGLEPFILAYLALPPENVIADYLDPWRDSFYETGAYRFSANSPEATLNVELNEKPLYEAADYLYIPGFGTSKWSVCSSKQNSGVYIEHDAFEGLETLWQAINPGGPLNGDYVMLTVWNDTGEDNGFSKTTKPFPFYRNPDIRSYTHRGFHEFSRIQIRAFRRKRALTRDWVYWAYRQHPKDLPAPAGDECVEYGTEPAISGDIQDAIYVTTDLKAPAEVHIRLGGSSIVLNQPAGLAHARVPWNDDRGRPRFTLLRDGVELMARNGRLVITDTPIGLDGEGTRNFNHYADYMSRK